MSKLDFSNTAGTTPFEASHIYTYLKGYFTAKGWTMAVKSLAYARAAHSGQKRKGGQPYILHPLTVTAHAIALGLDDEKIVTACLLHDVVEDCGVKPAELPVDDQETRHAIELLTHEKTQPLDEYYSNISGSPIASIVKLFDRCDNVSTMAGVFSDAKTLSYSQETRQFVMPLWRAAKDLYPEYSPALFVLKYHIMSLVNGLEAVLEPAGEET